MMPGNEAAWRSIFVGLSVMARKLKVFRTSVGFFDLAIAAPSMKAAAEAWGSSPDIFQRGFAQETDDPKVVGAAMAKPGLVLRRPVGSDGEYTEKAALPKLPDEQGAAASRAKPKSVKKPVQSHPAATAGAAAKEAKKQARDQRKEDMRRERAKKERARLIALADAAFEKATARHNKAIEELSRRRRDLEKAEADEKRRWEIETRHHKMS